MRYMVFTKKSLILAIIIVLVVILSLCLIFSSGPAITAVAAKKELPIYCTKQTEKIASLSFDAAWGAEDTKLLIDILARYKVKANFFLVGQWVDKYPNEVKALAAAGHEIGNHSNTHPHMPSLSRENMISELKNCNDKIEALIGKRPTLFRAPYGDYSNGMLEAVKSQGMNCIQWDVDSLDWKDLSADRIIERVTTKVSNGSIILFHNAAKNTPEALPKLIEKLQSEGYKLVPISKQLYKDNYTIDHEGRQCPSTEPKVTVNVTIAN